MSEKNFGPDDPRLTAYVLGELSQAERAAVERQLAVCSESRAVVDELRTTTEQLSEALQREPLPMLTPEQRATIEAVSQASRRQPLEPVSSPVVLGRVPRRPAAARTAVLVTGGVTVVAASLLALIVPRTLHNERAESDQLLAQLDGPVSGRWGEVAGDASGSLYFGDDVALKQIVVDFDASQPGEAEIAAQLSTAGSQRGGAVSLGVTEGKGRTTRMAVDSLQRQSGSSHYDRAETNEASAPLVAGSVVNPAPVDAAGIPVSNFTTEQLQRGIGGQMLNKRPALPGGSALGRSSSTAEAAGIPASQPAPASSTGSGALIAGPTPEPAFRRRMSRGVTVEDESRTRGSVAPQTALPQIESAEKQRTFSFYVPFSDRGAASAAPATPADSSAGSSGAVDGTQRLYEQRVEQLGAGHPLTLQAQTAQPQAVQLQTAPAETVHESVRELMRSGNEPTTAPSAGDGYGGYGGSLGGLGGMPASGQTSPNEAGTATGVTPLSTIDPVTQQLSRESAHPGDLKSHTVRGEAELKQLEDLDLLRLGEPAVSFTNPAPQPAGEDKGLGTNGVAPATDLYGTIASDSLGTQLMVTPRIIVGEEEPVGDLGVPFRQGSFEWGVPRFKAAAGRRLLAESEQLGYRFVRVQDVQTPPAGAVPVASDFGVGWMVPGTEAYNPIVENKFLPADSAPVSTFGLDVDTASYANVRRFLVGGQWPPPDAVRLEELINYFRYDDPAPVGEHPLACHLETAACPWNTNHQLVRIGLTGQELDVADRPPTTLVFLIDTSGSMRDENKLPLVKASLKLLTQELTENDRIAIVTYASEAQALLESTPGDQHAEIMSVIDSLNANGSTNGEGGLKLAYKVATQHFIDYGTNRVILCTDGDFNVGESDDAPLVQLISGKRKSGVFLSICGFGSGNLKDAKLEQIADKGNGQYHYIDGIGEARKVFLEDLAGMLYTLAKDVKLQVVFNSRHVASYRLLGYENRLLAKEDFDNDQIDAGDLSAGHTVSALYEIVPVKAPANVSRQSASGRRQSPDTGEAEPDETAADQPVFTARVARQVGEALVAHGLDQGLFDIHVDRDVVTLRGMAENRAQADRYIRVVQSVASVREVRDQLGIRRTSSGDDTATDLGENLLVVHLRYKQPRSDTSVKLDFPLAGEVATSTPSDNLEWSAAVASFGMILRNSEYRGQSSFDSILELAHGAKGDDPSGRRREFIDLVLQARAIWQQARGQSAPAPPELSSIDARTRATMGGKYQELLDKLEVREDAARYGSLHDYGWSQDREYAGRTELPAGYWVYVYPNWYIWGETVGVAADEAQPQVEP